MKRALISVSDKTGVVDFAKSLVGLGFEIISTGGTKKALEDNQVPVIGIEEVTDFPEMLDGRVKTLHPAIHGGLLARRDDPAHMQAIEAHNIAKIDLVCVNLYPFQETIAKPDVKLGDAIENIDIGGPSMLRSAAKNYAAVTVVVDSADYAPVLVELEGHGAVTFETNQRLAAKVFRHTAAYDALIAGYLTDIVQEEFPEKITLTYNKKQDLRYGENPHQKAAFYTEPLGTAASISEAKQLHGKELSYNNIRDTDAALRIAAEFTEPVAVAVKHMNPCGVGVGSTPEEAYLKAYEADETSIFGGIVAINREVDAATATHMSQIFLEIIIAPSFSEEAFAILSQKKNIRLLTVPFAKPAAALEKTSVLGGLLLQESDAVTEEVATYEVVTEVQPSDLEWKALIAQWKVVKHVKSNAIVVGNDKQTLGIGAGQMNRIGSALIALNQAGEKAQGAVLASDAFFPMDDTVEAAAKAGVKAIIQPGGSIKDKDSIAMANKYGIAMVITHVRHFKH
ncbi:bifunctional phosphoribosylaminoimidazolecarboxamide formyltransferase/IMP cyclohydrolase [Listeria booriae]|uniref:bifunctional phosphoribosylaminoimidazolecarboxamide formyltransferase/IMP cyclohydrolase n=1 Tax=Listeria booriae TaxID=1552123 RepID=UPI00162AE59B|nr:bifunctional phosphoribosylaminoimidazolecarboxamide formyltransferase/IMP cyclohydrolase [Listeria booriae]MBC1575951.1 bifunctional phosphoribosylaminoimidazolecarboxamide formyltransferase/IMP cyclohydrolase [Listeria booriae]MBC2208340.1 bifunctional phosphoribosylaminoimidazolecarboxamide formyltransferase/IMP cyclohydrolase [Listeria booriae]MBC2370278.1 bifunctional phosphoribosylaminoimidazolecarboxamide formyltransferase/IMP cyclohydrolase [Listeria booriae]